MLPGDKYSIDYQRGVYEWCFDGYDEKSPAIYIHMY